MVPILALAAISVLASDAMPHGHGQPARAGASFLRADAGGTATVRILTPALVGSGLDAPRPGMTPRRATLGLPGGGDRLLLVYDFE